MILHDVSLLLFASSKCFMCFVNVCVVVVVVADYTTTRVGCRPQSLSPLSCWTSRWTTGQCQWWRRTLETVLRNSWRRTARTRWRPPSARCWCTDCPPWPVTSRCRHSPWSWSRGRRNRKVCRISAVQIQNVLFKVNKLTIVAKKRKVRITCKWCEQSAGIRYWVGKGVWNMFLTLSSLYNPVIRNSVLSTFNFSLLSVKQWKYYQDN